MQQHKGSVCPWAVNLKERAVESCGQAGNDGPVARHPRQSRMGWRLGAPRPVIAGIDVQKSRAPYTSTTILATSSGEQADYSKLSSRFYRSSVYAFLYRSMTPVQDSSLLAGKAEGTVLRGWQADRANRARSSSAASARSLETKWD